MADAIKDTFLAHESSKNIKKKPATDREEIILGISLTQYSLRSGLKVLGDRGDNAVVKELSTIHDMDTFTPVDAENMTLEERKPAISSLMFLKEKTTATSKDEHVPTAPNRGSISRRKTRTLQWRLLNQS